MKPAKFLFFCLPVFISLFMETLVRGTFYAFGYQAETGLFTVTFPSVLALLFAMASVHSFWGKIKYIFILLIGMDLAGLYIHSAGYTSPLLALLSAVCSSAVSFLILQMAGFQEVFILGLSLLGIDLLTTGQVVVNYVIIYLTASAGIYLALFYMNLTNDQRIRKGTANVKGYKGFMTSLLLLLLAFMVYGYGQTGTALKGSGNNGFLKSLVNKIPLKTTTGKDAYTSYWEKLDDFELQGEISVKDNRIMSVKTTQPGYLRAESADYYTGRGWKNSLILRQVNQKDLEEGPESRGKKKISQEIRLAPDFKTGVVFTIGQPIGLEISQGDLATDGGGNYYIYNAPAGLSYQVSSVAAEAARVALEGNTGRKQDLSQNSVQYPTEIRNLYLQLPEGIPYRVKTLAAALTRDAGSQYEKVKQIESFLKNNFKYDLKISPPPPGRDVTDYFLFDLKRGYCTYHSTAMVVMLRSIGIPARWVKGFTPGVYNQEKDAYEISLADAHSWVEVYFPQHGWITLEPTPGFDPSVSQRGKEVADNEFQNSKRAIEPTAVINEAVSNRENKPKEKGRLFGLISLLILTGLILVRRKITRAGVKTQRIDLIFEAFENTMGKKGFVRQPFQTPLEYAGILKEHFRGVSSEICRLAEIYMTWKYGGRNADPEEVREAELILKRIRDNI